MNSTNRRVSGELIEFSLDFRRHNSLISTNMTFRRTMNRFMKIVRGVVRVMNLQEPVENKLWFRQIDEGIILYENKFSTNSKLEQIVITIEDNHYFAPWIYEFYQRSSRVLIYKEMPTEVSTKFPSVTTENSTQLPIDNQSVTMGNPTNNLMQKLFLVHRSYPNGELQHPGGHLQYIETGCRYDHSKGYYLVYETGIDYVRMLVSHLLTYRSDDNFVITKEDITPSMERWFRFGGIREVLEESGLDLVHDLSRLNLIKIGTKTFYMSLRLSLDIFETGPMGEFAKEVVDYHTISNIIYSRRNLSEFDRFWLLRSDRLTDHAWLTRSEMIGFWEAPYRSHALELVEEIGKND
jgi:8-oxo-dGTP pyrophosphatase MutT (NUDIX family)